jgi:YidC/Oxa1 family membrane protein insertase
MDQFRLVIAIALSFLIFITWGYFSGSKEKPQKPEQQQTAPQTSKESPYVKESAPIVTPQIPVVKEFPAQPPKEARMITVDAPLYAVKISEKGAVFKSYVLKDYRERVEQDSPLKELVPKEIYTGTILLGFMDKSLPDLNNAAFTTQGPFETVSVSDRPEEISFVWTSPQGIVVEKKYLFPPETYQIGLTVTIKNGSGRTLKDNMVLSLMSVVPGKESRYGFSGPSALINNRLEQVIYPKKPRKPICVFS